MDDLKDQKMIQELWPGINATQFEGLGGLNMNFDMKNGKISVKSESKDTHSLPQFEWVAHPDSGNVTETRRQADGQREQTLIKNDGLSAFSREALVQDLNQEASSGALLTNTITDSLKPEEMTQEEWDEIEAQRDIAFKIMYFFIVFILATFGMLYAYFKMAQ